MYTNYHLTILMSRTRMYLTVHVSFVRIGNMKENKYQEFMDLEAVADYLDVPISTIYIYINTLVNPLPSFQITKRNIRVKKGDLDIWIESLRKTKEEKN